MEVSVDIGVIVPQGWTGEYDGWDASAAWRRTRIVAEQAERVGFESVWVFDHFQAVAKAIAAKLQLGPRSREQDTVGGATLSFDISPGHPLEPAVLGLLQKDPDDRARGDAAEAKRIDALVQQRIEARKAKDFAAADQIRKTLAAEGIEIMDGPDGSTWRRV